MMDDPHENCPGGYHCAGPCDRYICPRCNPSPQELNHICADCDWNDAA